MHVHVHPHQSTCSQVGLHVHISQRCYKLWAVHKSLRQACMARRSTQQAKPTIDSFLLVSVACLNECNRHGLGETVAQISQGRTACLEPAGRQQPPAQARRPPPLHVPPPLVQAQAGPVAARALRPGAPSRPLLPGQVPAHATEAVRSTLMFSMQASTSFEALARPAGLELWRRRSEAL